MANGMAWCGVCPHRCELNRVPISREMIADDLVLAQRHWRKATRNGNLARARHWAAVRDLALKHLYPED